MKGIIRTLSVAAAGLGLALTLTAAPSSAQSSYPSVANLTPFSASCNFMSQAGYLRYLVFEQQGVWMSRSEAVAVVQHQIATGD